MGTDLGNEEIPRYLRVYQYYKELILSGKWSRARGCLRSGRGRCSYR